MTLDHAAREALTAQFRAYLDTLMDEPDRDGQEVYEPGAHQACDPSPDPDEQLPAPDLFAFFTELAVLKNEVKRESRQVKTALDEFRSLFDSLRETQTRLADEQERRCEQTRATDRAGWRDLLLELLELRDRLKAGQEQAARFQPHWYARNRREVRLITTLAEGMAMNLRRLEESLARRGVRPIPTLGRLFDPHRMQAAELVRDPEYRSGEVMAELRPGWMLHDDMLRIAEVAVNRIDQSDDYSPDTAESST